MTSLLPDRERRHLLQFHVAPRLSYGPRLIIALGLIGLGLVLQYLLLPSREGAGPAFAATLLVLIGNLFLLLKGYDLRPRGASGGEWERTTVDRFDETFALDRQVRRWDSTSVDATCGRGCLTFGLLVVAPSFVVVAMLIGSRGVSGRVAALVLVDVLVLIAPHWFTGTRRKWRPAGLLERIRALRVALRALEDEKSPPCQVQPMLRVVREGEKQVPTDARVFIRFPDGPEEFLGLQLQVAVNLVQGTRYPYLYAVLVAKQGFRLIEKHYRRVAELAQGRNLTVEKKREDDVEVIVIRQHTTKESGYHTGDGAVAALAEFAWRSAARIVQSRTPTPRR